ncbi:hypothetical protein [Thalassobellus citreus]|uniref:hypothetical protein n=1 Tax=Thalassobellus citreus TaxID=3367752 RepID=UPI0037A4FB6D
MNTQKIIFKLIITLLTFSSCSKDDNEEIDDVFMPQYPMKALIESGYMQVTYEKVNEPDTFEFGYKFKSFKNGKITALGIRVPNNGIYRVTLWNVDTEEILITKHITSSSGLLSFEDIDDVNVDSGTNYYVSINTNDYYQFSSPEEGLFPVESGDILITGASSNLGTEQVLPFAFSEQFYIGIVDVKFVPNN